MSTWSDELGGLTPEQVTEIFLTAFGNIKQGCPLQPGDIVLSGAATTPQNRLECDGASYNTADYPLLFDAIGYQFGGSGATFRVPDFRGRSPVGQGSGPGLTSRTIGDTGGGESTVLNEGNLPSHSHGSHSHVTTPMNGGLEAPVFVLTEIPANTGNTGSGDAFTNMHPYNVVRFTIVYQ